DMFVRQYQDAHADLVRVVGQGQLEGTVQVPPRRTTYSRYGLGALYCRMLDAVGVQTAHAAEPPRQAPVPEAEVAPGPAPGAGTDTVLATEPAPAPASQPRGLSDDPADPLNIVL